MIITLAEWDDSGRRADCFWHDAQIDIETFLLFNRNDDAVYKWSHKNGFVEKAEFVVSMNMLFNSKLNNNYLLNLIEMEDDLEGYILYI